MNGLWHHKLPVALMSGGGGGLKVSLAGLSLRRETLVLLNSRQ